MQYAEDYTQRISIFESGIGRIKNPVIIQDNTENSNAKEVF